MRIPGNSVLHALALLAFAQLGVFATAITPDGTFHQFQFSGTINSAVFPCGGSCLPTTNPVAEQASSPPWTFSGPASIFITDVFQVADRFEVFDNLVSLGQTSAGTNDGSNPCGGDIACAIANPKYSNGTFIVGGGAHSLTINVIQIASGITQGGSAVFEVTAIPEPGTLVLLGAGLVFLGLLRRRH